MTTDKGLLPVEQADVELATKLLAVGGYLSDPTGWRNSAAEMIARHRLITRTPSKEGAVAWAVENLIVNFTNRPGDENFGVAIPLRKTPGGPFQMPLYREPLATGWRPIETGGNNAEKD